MLFGGDYLAAVKYQKAMLQAHPKGWAGGIFLRTFGEARKTVRAMGKSRKFSEVVVHLASFDYTHAYPVNKLKKQLINDARWLNRVANEFPGTKWLCSPFCEHNHRREVMEEVFEFLNEVAPACIMLNSIWKGDEVPGVLTEIHVPDSKGGPKKPKNNYTVSFDGFGGDGSGNFTDADIPKILERYSDARHIRFWNFRLNGKFGHKDKTTIANRASWPNADYIKQLAATMKEREGFVSWPKTSLYKPMSDDHGNGAASKDNKALAILKSNMGMVKVFDKNGNHIDTMKRMMPDFNTPELKGGRFYSGKYAYQIADAAEKLTGSRQIKIHDMPLTDGDLRSNLFK